MKKYRVTGHKIVEVTIEVEANSPIEAILAAGKRPAVDWREHDMLRDTIEVVASTLVK